MSSEKSDLEDKATLMVKVNILYTWQTAAQATMASLYKSGSNTAKPIKLVALIA